MEIRVWEEWLASSENWKQSTWAVNLKTYRGTESIGCRRWMTRAQILQKYDGNVDAVDAIVATKMEPANKPTQVKAHPDAPTCVEPRHFMIPPVHSCN